jgi:hypothetical protein
MSNRTTYNDGLHRAIEIAEMFADENVRMANDITQLETQFNPLSTDQKADRSMLASRAFAAKDIANAIRIELGEEIGE